MCVTISPISSMCPTIASSGPFPVPGTRATEEPSESPVTPRTPTRPRATLQSARPRSPDGPGAVSSERRTDGAPRREPTLDGSWHGPYPAIDDSPRRAGGHGARSGAGACASDALATSPSRCRRPRKGAFFVPVIAQNRHRNRPPHPARGVPAPARERSRVVPARVGRARTPRPLLARRLRARGSSTSRGGSARGAGRRLRLATTTSRSSSPRCRSPSPARASPRPASSSPTSSSASTTSPAWPRCSAEIPPRSSRSSTAPLGEIPNGNGAASGPLRRLPPARVRTDRRRREGAHPRGRRVPDRALPARRAADLRRRDPALPLASPCQPVAVPLPPGARRRPRAGRLLARDTRQGRGRRASVNPIAGTSCAGKATRSDCSRPRRTARST